MFINTIEVRGLTKVYQNKGEKIIANNNIELVIREGEIIGLLGPNGAGKTTLIKQIIGQLKPTSGSIFVKGIDVVKNPREIQHFLGYMPQFGYTHLPHLTILEALNYIGQLRKLDRKTIKQKIDFLINRMELKNERQRLIGRLSGGKAQAVRLCLALMGNPSIVVLDEPTNGLDPAMRRKFWQVIKEIYEKDRQTIIWVTHNVQEAEVMAHRVVIMRTGKILTFGTPQELKERVYGTLRIEIIFKEKSKVIENLVNEIGGLMIGECHYLTFLPKENLGRNLLSILNSITLDENVEDIRILPVSLEDVYIQLTKEKIE